MAALFEGDWTAEDAVPADAVTGYKGLGINGYEDTSPVRGAWTSSIAAESATAARTWLPL
ncbi:hypothetical protein [Streptomyces sp. Caat 7-52]|uniref:hypothetical protein n=1 Tax=Streptomyces sp. Caat 7-52 TaxID=2949637 RepID=UPI0020359DDB|nr:hypothetical protein [Streptomyces sp. Caat 7-52]